MNEQTVKFVDHQDIDRLYQESAHWDVNTGGQTIHARRIKGHFRRIKWFSMLIWASYLFGPYLRWQDRQAIYFDLPKRQFHFFDLTLVPQDIWMLALVLLFFALLLAAATSVAGRVFCGYFCFQTVWTDVFTWIETKFEGKPNQRRKLDQAPWSLNKLRIKISKHMIWLAIGVYTGIAFVCWFGDAYSLWPDIVSFDAPIYVYTIISVFTFFTYAFAGFMREQVCLWLCPYARIQGVMMDASTVVPTYDVERGEPRGRLKRQQNNPQQGDCIDCNLCVAVCPTGVDIRHGQQIGCITCGLCIDACDSVMTKINKPTGLVRYASLDEMQHHKSKPLYQRPRVLIYCAVLLLALSGILYGVTNRDLVQLNIVHGRQPLYVIDSDGAIRNKYTLKVLNKNNHDLLLNVSAHGLPGLTLINADRPLRARNGRVTSHTVFVKVPRHSVSEGNLPITFSIQGQTEDAASVQRDSIFIGPAP